MKLVRTLSMIIALAGASTVHAQAPAKTPAPAPAKAPAPAEKKAPDKPAAKEELSPAEVQKAEKFFDELYNAVVKNQDACPKMATALNAVLDKHQDWLKKMVDSGKDLPQASKDRMQKKQADLGNGIMKCKDDKAVVAAMQRFMTIATAKKADQGPAPAPAAPPPAKK
jgi:hypothetical protein